MKLTCVIIDDEAHSRETTQMLIRELDSNIQVVGMAKDAFEGSKIINELQPHFILLDIQMPYKSGVEMLDMIPNYKGEIVFVTAHDSYAIEAFRKGALHYVLKPIDIIDLEEVLKRVKLSLQKIEHKGKYLSLSTIEGWIVIRRNEIIRCESYKNYTTIFLSNTQYTISKSIKEVESVLPSNNFYRVHNSHLINIDYVQKVLRTDGGNILMINEDLIPISKAKKKNFFDWFNGKMERL